MIQKKIYQFFKLILKSIGRLSDGIQISYEQGLTSGKMLDYVYENKIHGRWGIGLLIDYIFLSHRAWRSIREREKNLVLALKDTVDKMLTEGKKVHILDIAAGKARYLFRLAQSLPNKNIDIHCRDFDQSCVDEGNAKAKELGLKQMVFENKNAFDEKEYEKIKHQYNLIVASGFYDWITDSEKIINSVKTIYETLPLMGYFILTQQVDHFNLKFVEEVFEDFNHQNLKMTTHSQELMHGWLKDIGFQIHSAHLDHYGCYLVTVAQKAQV